MNCVRPGTRNLRSSFTVSSLPADSGICHLRWSQVIHWENTLHLLWQTLFVLKTGCGLYVSEEN